MAPLSKRKPVEPKLDDVVIKAGEGRIMSSADILHPPIEDEIGLGEHEKASREVVDAESDRRPALEVCDDGNSEHHATETQEVAPNGGREKDRSTLLNGGGKTHMAGRTDERSSSAPRQTPPRKSSKHYSSAYMTNARSNPRIPRKLDAEDIPSESSNIAHCFQLQPAQAQSDHVSSNRTNAVEARGEDTTHLKEIERLKRELTKKDTQIALKDAEIERKSELLDQLSKKIRDQKREIEDQESMTKAEVQRRNRQTIRIRQQASTMSEQDQRLRDLERQVQQLQEENVEKSKVNRDVNDAWRRATNELARLTQQSQVYKVDDTMLMGMYEGIIYSAGNWAANYCGGRGRTFFSQDELSPLMPLTMYYAQYASSEKLRPVLIQSLIVKKLAMTVLNYSDIEPVGCLWAGRLSPGLRQIQKGLEPGEGCAIPGLLAEGHIRSLDVKEFAAWKAKTAHLVADAVDQEDVNLLVGQVIAGLRDDLHPFVTVRGAGAWVDLGEVVQKAVELDKELSKSRALFTFDNFVGKGVEAWGFPFDDGTTVSVDGFEPAKGGMNVELVVAPFFTKTGTAGGDFYDKLKLLGKCVALCTESRMKLEKF